MAVLAAILPVVSRSSSLALQLFGVAAKSPEAAKDFVAVASKVNGFAAILKQVGTIIKEDDRLPSLEVRFLHIIGSAARLAYAFTNLPAEYEWWGTLTRLDDLVRFGFKSYSSNITSRLSRF